MPGHDLTADRLAMRVHARQVRCPHINAVIVLSAAEDKILAWLCPECDAQLPADFGGVRRCCRTPHGLWHQNYCEHARDWNEVMA